MQRALVIKIHGNQQIGSAIVNGMESKELKTLREIVGVSSTAKYDENQKRIEELHRKIPIKEHSERYDRFWGYVGLAWLILTEGRVNRKRGY